MEDVEIEDNEYVASEHDRLISAITKLDKTQHITEPSRSEPTNLNSEFGLVKRSKKLDLSNVIEVLGETGKKLSIGKQLKRFQDSSKVLPKPLEKPQAERIKRATGYEETKKLVGRWDPVVARNRTVDFVSYPLKSVTGKPKHVDRSSEFLARLTSKSELEKELEEIDSPTMEMDDEEDEEQTYPMSYEEMVEHRQHLAKMRAQQSYQAAKAKRQSKIKSKKYHRILKKEKLKQQLKEFEELQKTNPEEALKKLEALEKARALERHTLRHKNTGKWAKSKLVRAKYDKDVRQQLAEQLAVSRGLTQKTQNPESSDDEADVNEAIPDMTLAQDPMNPWMLRRSDKSNVDAEFDFGYKKYLKGKMFKRPDQGDDSDQEDSNKVTEIEPENLESLKENIKKLNESSDEIDETTPIENIEAEKEITNKDSVHSVSKRKKTNKKAVEKKSKPIKKNKTNLVSTSQWVVEPANETEKEEITEEITSAFETLESDMSKQIENKLKKVRQDIEKLEKQSRKVDKQIQKENEDIDNLEYLKLKNQNPKALIDEELIETSFKIFEPPEISKDIKITNTFTEQVDPGKTTDNNIDPSRFIAVKPKYLNSVLPKGDNDLDELDDDDDQIVPKVNIEEVFEEDDVVANFRQEKEDEINKDKPEDVELGLPGWGSWGGKGVKPQKRKRNRFILKAPPKVPRRDENKGDIIIKEYSDPKLSAHKVSDVPFPFTSVKDYEASIRAPIGNTFIPEKAHKKLIKPSVITKAGAIIEPMTEEELLRKRNRTFKNQSVIKLLGQK